MNPCPCGWLGSAGQGGRLCRCTPDAVLRYQGRISGPLLDRIDLQVEVQALPAHELLRAPSGETSAQVAQRVSQARARQLQRQGKTNDQLSSADIHTHCALSMAAQHFAQQVAERLGWSGRSLHRVMKVARTVADLAQAEHIAVDHLAEAVQWRRGLATGHTGA